VGKYQTGTVASNDALFQVWRTLLLANGWTAFHILADSVDNRDIVFRSSPIDAIADNRAHIRIIWILANGNFQFRVYRGWDTVAAVGFQEVGDAGISYFPGQGSSFTYFARVNPYAMAFVNKTSGPNYWCTNAGFLNRGMDPRKNGLTKTTQSYASGVTSMNVASDMTGKLKVGQRVMIMNNSNLNASPNKLNAQVRIIQAIASGSITFTAVTTQAFDSGAVIGWNPMPAFVCSPNTPFPTGNFYTPLNLDGTASGGAGAPNQMLAKPVTYVTGSNPGLNSEHGSLLFTVVTSVASKDGHYGILHHWRGMHPFLFSGANPAAEALFDASNDSFIVIGNDGTAAYLLGPR
jgi:hypothetical protein